MSANPLPHLATAKGAKNHLNRQGAISSIAMTLVDKLRIAKGPKKSVTPRSNGKRYRISSNKGCLSSHAALIKQTHT
jgi:hypothetical protein